MARKGTVSKRTLQRKMNRKHGLMAVTRHKINIAGMNVMENENVPVGVMIVNPQEADRLNEMVVEASNRKALEKTTEQGYDEADPAHKVSVAQVAEKIAELELAGADVTVDSHVIYASPRAVFETDYSEYELDIITNENLPEGVVFEVVEKGRK